METNHGPPWTRNNGYETLDYILVENRWKNSIKDCEVDHSGFIPTDHYPIIAKIRVKFKKIPKNDRRARPKYLEATAGEKSDFNETILEILEKTVDESGKPTMEQLLEAINEAGIMEIPKDEAKKKKQPHISIWLESLLKEREYVIVMYIF